MKNFTLVEAHQKSHVVLVTTTFSKSVEDMRAQLALKTCRAAKENGYQIIVVDGSPCADFKSELKAAGATVFDQKKPGMGQSRRECLWAGHGTMADVIVWLEPEKYPLVPLLEPCIDPVLRACADAVIPRRRSLEGYPHYQQWSEYVGNWAIGEITGRYDLDFYIGPRVLSRTAVEVMAAYQGVGRSGIVGDNWEILFIPILWMLDRCFDVSSVTVDYVHPVEQLIEDDEAMRAKRDKQRFDLVAAMAAEAKHLGWM